MSRALASTEKPRITGSLNTVAMGAAWDVSLNKVRIVAANSAAVRRRSMRGPGTLLVHDFSLGRASGGVMIAGPPPVPIGVVPPEPPFAVDPPGPAPPRLDAPAVPVDPPLL